ncbi:MAG: ABC transporter ATP-binding protein/permease [Firmicutes bacterium]|jgi:ATP-binding cassette subfamily B protein|nr:ABC transporter ATP-binding protein/permease [Bacillota bacterium]
MYKRLMPYYKPHMKLFLFDMFCAMIVAVVDLIFPMYSREMINRLIPQGKIDLMVRYSVLILILYLIRTMCHYFMNYWGHVMGSRIEYDMRSQLFEHLQGLHIKFFDENKTGQIMSRLVGDLGEIAELTHHGPEDLFISIILLSGSFVILFRINIILTALTLVMVVLLVFFTINRRNHLSSSFMEVRKMHGEINSKIENSISGIRLTRSFANEEYEMNEFDKNNTLHRDSKKEAYRAIGIFSTGTVFLADTINLVVIGIGGYFVYNGSINLGDLVAFLLYASFFIRPIRRLIQFTQQYQRGIVGFKRFLEILDTENIILESEDPVEVDELNGDIRFKDVSFSYDGKNDVLKDFNLQVEQGKTVALVGHSGVGKTTISNLIPRFYDVTDGEILINDINIKDYSLKSLRSNIGFVQQDVYIFYGTILENITYGNPGASYEEVIEASKKASIHDFIMGLPDGFETVVGERGIKLSGGQKQRISLARVFLKNPPILILDEATSSLDNESERAIQKSIELVSQDRTAIVIAHRLSTIVGADQIVVIDENGIIENGSHNELLSLDGSYKKLFDSQYLGAEK